MTDEKDSNQVISGCDKHFGSLKYVIKTCF